MRGVKPRSSGLLTRLSPDKGEGYSKSAGTHEWVGRGPMKGTLQNTHAHTSHSDKSLPQTGMCMLAHAGHAPFRRWSFSWLSSPWAASWWIDRAGGIDKHSVHLLHALSGPQFTLFKIDPLLGFLF